MSLRAFHLFFVAASIAMCLVVAAWGVGEYRHHSDTAALVLAAVCAVLGGGLVFYGVKVYRKLMELGR